MFKEYLDCAVEAVLGAADIVRPAFGRQMLVETKSVAGDFVTQSDRQAERRIVDIIRRRFPSHGIFGEEETDTIGDGAEQWFIDPIDGTTNFTLSIPWFCISVALVIAGETTVGVIMNPITQEMITAARGHGAYLNSDAAHQLPLAVSKTTQLEQAAVSASWWSRADQPELMQRGMATFQEFARHALKMRYISSTALDMVHVARGHFDLMTCDTRFIDVAAASLILEEAGGRVTDLAGNQLDPSDRSVKRIIATNGLLHDTATQLVR